MPRPAPLLDCSKATSGPGKKCERTMRLAAATPFSRLFGAISWTISSINKRDCCAQICVASPLWPVPIKAFCRPPIRVCNPPVSMACASIILLFGRRRFIRGGGFVAFRLLRRAGCRDFACQLLARHLLILVARVVDVLLELAEVIRRNGVGLSRLHVRVGKCNRIVFGEIGLGRSHRQFE